METQILPSISDIIRNEQAAQSTQPVVFINGLLNLGEIVGGYEVQKKLATDSGEAEIYLCTKDANTFILKYYYNKHPQEDVIKKLSEFRHPDIVSLLQYGEYKDRAYEIDEYAAGGSLADKKSDGTYRYLPVSYETAKQIIKETVNAFLSLHKAGIIHRDIKPENLYYRNADGSDIVVGDFGISSYFEADEGMSKHITKTTAGTEGYTAPEVYSGVIGPEADYYSLGVTVWVLLTGFDPFVNEKGQAMFPGQIMLDAIQGKTAEKLLARTPHMNADFRDLICGLLTVRHDKRWGYQQVQDFLTGKKDEVFIDKRELPPFEFNGKTLYSFRQIAESLLAAPEEGKKAVYGGLLVKYLVKIDQNTAEKILDLSEKYSADKEPYKGLVHIAYSLCPDATFRLGDGPDSPGVSSLQDIIDVLEEQPSYMLPYLADETKGFYTYLDVVGLGKIGKKIFEIAQHEKDSFFMRYRIIVALKGNSIKPFQDGINNDVILETAEHLYRLPDYLHERIMYLIDRKDGLVCGWLENVTGCAISEWYEEKRFREGENIPCSTRMKQIEKWGTWHYFILFLKNHDCIFRFCKKEGDGKCGLADLDGEGMLLPALWEDAGTFFIRNRFIVKRGGKWGVINNNGKNILPFNYDSIKVFDEENEIYEVRTEDSIQYLDEQGKELYSFEDSGDDGGITVFAMKDNPFAVCIRNDDDTKIILARDFRVICRFDDIEVTGEKDSSGETVELKLWVKNKKRCSIRGLDGKEIKQLPFAEFMKKETAHGDVFITGDGALQRVYDRNGNPLSAEYDDMLTGSGTEYAAVLKNGKWGLINADTGKELIEPAYGFCSYSESFCIFTDDNLLLKIIDFSGKTVSVYGVNNKGGEFVFYGENRQEILPHQKKIIGFPPKYDDNNSSLALESIKCFSGDSLYEFQGGTFGICMNLDTSETDALFNVVSKKDFLQMLRTFKSQNEFIKINSFVEASWKYFFDKKDWETARMILFFVRMDHMENLSHPFSFYKAEIAETLSNEENWDDASDFYDAAIMLDPRNESYYWKNGDCCCKLEKYDKALELFEKALEFDPEDMWLLNRKGNALFGLGKNEEAIAAYTLALQYGEKSVFYNNRANVYDKMGWKDQVRSDRSKARLCHD